MPITKSFTPASGTPLGPYAATTDQPVVTGATISQNFGFTAILSTDNSDVSLDLSFVDAGNNDIPDGSTVYPGLTVNYNGLGVPATASLGVITLQGVPKGQGSFTLRLKGTFDNGFGIGTVYASYVVTLSGASITLNPAGETLTSATVGTPFTSGQIFIKNGSSSGYTVTLSGASNPLYLTDSLSVFPSPASDILTTTAGSFYIYGTPTSAVSNENLTITIKDNGTQQSTNVSAFYFTAVNSSGGTLNLTWPSSANAGGNPPYAAGTAYQAVGFTMFLSETSGTGTGPYSWSVSSGSLPAGLAFNNTTTGGTTNQIVGIPTVYSVGGTPFTFTLKVQDNAGHFSTLPVSLVISAEAALSGNSGSFTAPTFPTVGVVGTPVSNQNYYVKGGDNALTGPVGVYFRYQLSSDNGTTWGAVQQGLPTGLYTTPTLVSNSLDGGNTNLCESLSPVVGGTPGAPGTYKIFYGTQFYANGSPHVSLGYTAFANFNVSSAGTLTFNPTTISPWTQFAANNFNVSVVGATGNINPWSLSGINFGTDPGLSTTLNAGNTAQSGVITGTSIREGTRSLLLTAQDSSGSPKTGSQAYSFTVLPAIYIFGNPSPELPNGVTGSGYSHTLTFIGGKDTQYTYVWTDAQLTTANLTITKNTVPVTDGGITWQGTDNSLTFTSSALPAGGAYPISVAVTTQTSTGSFTKNYNFSLTVTGSNVSISAITGAQTTGLNGKMCIGLSPLYNFTSASTKVGGKTSDGGTYGIISINGTPTTASPVNGWDWSGSVISGVASGASPVFSQATPTNGTFDFLLQSDNTPSAQCHVIVTVDTSFHNTRATITPNPATGTTMYAKDPNGLSFQATMAVPPGSPCVGGPTTGLWTIANDPTGLLKFKDGNNRTNPSTPFQVVELAGVPGNDQTPQTFILYFQPDVDGDAPPGPSCASAIINFVPGDRTSFDISNSNLISGSVGNTYNTVQLTTTGSTATPIHFGTAPTWQSFPNGIVMTDGGAISSNGISLPDSASGSKTFTISCHDNTDTNPLNCHWAAKTYTLSVGGTQPNVGSITPASGLSGGGQTVTVTGNNFVSTNKVGFTYSGVTKVADGGGANGQTTYVSATQLTVVTPQWTGQTNVATNVFIHDSITGDTGTLSSAFMFTGAPYNPTAFTPVNANTGAGDTTISITGSGFDTTAQVYFTPNWGTETLLAGAVVAPPGPGPDYIAYSSPTLLKAILPGTPFLQIAHAGSTGFFTVKQAGFSVTVPGTFTVIAGTLTISPSSSSVGGYLPSWDRSGAYSGQTLTASGGSGTYSNWAITNNALPDGLSGISGGGATKTISGTSSATATTKTFTVTVTDSLGAVHSEIYTIRVNGGAVAITTTPTALPDARIGSPYSKHLDATGGVNTGVGSGYTWSITSGSPPAGIAIGQTTGVLTGTPTTGQPTQTYSFQVTVKDGTTPTPLTASQTFTIKLNPAISAFVLDPSKITPNQGPLSGGTAVTIQNDTTGDGFINPTTVQFGSTASTSVTWNSKTNITAVSPVSASAGAVSISVSNPDGGNNSLSNAFTYVAASNPSILSLNILDGPFSGGQTVAMTGSNLGTVTAVKFGTTESNSVSAGIVSQSDTSLTLTTPPGTTFGDGSVSVPVTIFAYNPSGQGAFPAGDNGYIYRPPPIITSIVPSSGSTTGGQTVYVLGSNFFSRGGAKPRIFIGNVEVPSANITVVNQ